ncbi:MAG: hypothetical protein NVS3B18_12050 [Candidatus Dormibacteria bacterium]
MSLAGVVLTIPAHGAAGSTAVSAERDAGRQGDGRGRTVLVVGDDIELAVALRDRVERAYLTVCEVRPTEALAAVRACRPWPWMVIDDTAKIDDKLADAVARHPMLLLWRGPAPPGLPRHARAFELFSELTAAIGAAVHAEVAGIRLAPACGLTMPDGTHAGNAALEALVANHPHPLFAPVHDFRGAITALASHRVPLRLARGGSGGVSLARAQDT